MKKLLALILCSSLLISCTTQWETTKKETSEAIENIGDEAARLGEDIGGKLDQIQEAANSISGAVDAVQDAKDDIKAITEE